MIGLFAFPSGAAWLWLAATGIAAYGSLALMGVAVEPTPPLIMAGLCAILVGVAHIYRTVRPEPRLCVLAAGSAYVLAVSVTAGVLTYPAAALSGALWDGAFIRFERGLGVDWPTLAHWLAGGPAPSLLWSLAYDSSFVQIAAAIVALALTGRHERLRRFLVVGLWTTVAVTIASALFPAVGPIRAYGLGPEAARLLGDAGTRHLDQFLALRGGRLARLDLREMEGLITFPSFHCVMAITTAWALRPVRVLGPLAAVLNAIVVASTIPRGGHYVADVLAGAAIAVLAIAAVTRPERRPRPVAMALAPG